MRPNYVLIDYENVQPDSLGLLDREEFRIRLFIGANQASLKRNVAIAMQKLGPAKAEYVEISYRVSETKFNAWPETLKSAFAPARTLKTGKPGFRLALL